MPSLNDISSEQTLLVERCRQGDRQALSTLYSNYHDYLSIIAAQIVPDRQAAQDVEHDAWVMIFTSLTLLNDPARLTAWMRTIVRNIALNYLKHTQTLRTVALSEASGETEPVEAIPDFSFQQISSLVEQLPDGYEQVFRLKIFEGLSHRQIAIQLGITETTSRTKFYRAKQMMRHLLRHDGALILLTALVPVVILLLLRKTPADTPDIVKPTPTANIPTAPSTNDSVATSALSPAVDAQSPIAEATILPSPTLTDTSATTLPSTYMRGFVLCMPSLDIPYLPPIADSPTQPTETKFTPPSRNHTPRLNLAYGGMPASGTTVIDNFLTVVNFAAPGRPQSARLFTWKDYADYLKANESQLDSVTVRIMRSRLEQHTDTIIPDDVGEGQSNDSIVYDPSPLSEIKHHERPRTYMLSVAIPLSQRWSLNSGIGVKTMKSTFDSEDNGNYFTRRTQRLYYLSMPFGASYSIWHHRGLSVYASGSVQLDIPLKGKTDTRYLYTGPYEHTEPDSLVFPTVYNRFRPPFQWSVGGGVGVQYNLLPHVSIYFEPTLRYYIPTHSSIENYHSAHPFDVTLPFGVRIVP